MSHVRTKSLVSALIIMAATSWPAISFGQAYIPAYTYNRVGTVARPVPIYLTVPAPTPTPRPAAFRPIGPIPTVPPSLSPLAIVSSWFQRPTTAPTPLPQPTATYVALGDSVAKGFYSAKGYTGYYQQYLTQTGQPVVEKNLGQVGWQSADLLLSLRSDASVRRQVQNANYVTWNIGGNDLRRAREQYKNRTCGGNDNQDCLRQTTNQLKANWTGIMQEIRVLRANTMTTTRTMDIYNPYVARDQQTDTWIQDNNLNDWQVFDTYVRDINAYITATSANHSIYVAPVYTAFNGVDGTEDPGQKGYISFDGFHPNDRGHQAIAQKLTGTSFPAIQPIQPTQPAPVMTVAPTVRPTNIIWQPSVSPQPYYPTSTPTPIQVIGRQCPAGTHVVTMACTKSYPNPSCTTLCAANTSNQNGGNQAVLQR